MNSHRIKSGLTDFDNATGGLALGQLITVTGRPAMGKTAFAITLMVNIGIEQKIPMALLSLEMSNEQIINYIIKTTVDTESFNFDLGTKLQSRDTKVRSKLLFGPIHLDDTPVMNIEDIEEKISNLVSSDEVKIVVIDYLQLIRGFDVDPENIMRRLKAVAINYGISIITISQLYKDFYPLKPYDSDSDEDFFRSATKDIMDNSDAVVLLYRHMYYYPISDNTVPRDFAEAIILKGHNEQIEKVPLTFLPEFPKFTDYIADNNPSIKVVAFPAEIIQQEE